MFLWISMDVIYNSNRLDFHSDYSVITNKQYILPLEQVISVHID